MKTSREPRPAADAATADLHAQMSGYLPLEQGDCQAMAFSILRRCCGDEAGQPGARDGHPLTVRPAER